MEISGLLDNREAMTQSLSDSLVSNAVIQTDQDTLRPTISSASDLTDNDEKQVSLGPDQLHQRSHEKGTPGQTDAVDMQFVNVLFMVTDLGGRLSERLNEALVASGQTDNLSSLTVWQHEWSLDTANGLNWSPILSIMSRLESMALRISKGDQHKPELLGELGVIYNILFERLGQVEHLHKAIELHEDAASITADNNPDQPDHLNNLGNSWLRLFQLLGEPHYVYKAIEYQERALLLTPEKNLDRLDYLNSLGCSYMILFQRLGDIEHIKLAVEYQGRSLLLTPDKDPHRPSHESNLGSSYVTLFQRSGELEHLYKGLECLESSHRLTSDNDPKKHAYMSNLGNAYMVLFERLGDLSHLYRAISCHERAALTTLGNYPDKASRLHRLGNSRIALFKRLGELENLYMATGYYEHAISITADDHINKPMYLSSLGNSELATFERLGKPEHLHRAVDCYKRALLSTPDSNPNRARYLNNAGSLHQDLLKISGDIEHVYKAIDFHKHALLLIPNDHPDRVNYLNDLGGSYMASSENLWELEDLHKAIECFESAVLLTPDNHPDKSGRLSNLGSAYMALFGRLGEHEHVYEAAKHLERAALLTPDNHPDRSGRLNNLARPYLALFKLFGETKHLQTAINHLEITVSLTPDGHPDKPCCLNNLGDAYRALFEHSRQLQHLELATDYCERASLMAPEGHLDRPAYLKSLGRSYIILFKHLGEIKFLSKGIDYFDQAASLASDVDPEQPEYLHSIGYAYFSLALHSRQDEHLLLSRNAFRKAALCPVGPPSVRILAAQHWAKVCRFLQLDPLEPYAHCVALLPQTIWLGVSARRRHEHLVSDIRNLVTEFSSTAIELGRYELAVEWFEQGRCLVWGQLLQLRTPLDDLQASHPELSDALLNLSARLEPTVISSQVFQNSSCGKHLLRQVPQMHSRLADRRDKLIAKIRDIPRYKDFLRPPQLLDILRHVQGGVTVILNIDKLRCDALIMQPRNRAISHVHLRNFSYQKVLDARAQLACFIHGRGTQRGVVYGDEESRTSCTNLLSVLWYDVVEPVIDDLGIKQVLAFEELPHITWCITGPLSFLPIHAAGDYTAGSESILSNLTVSSYTPNITSIGHESSRYSKFSGILAVGHQSAIRGLKELPGTKMELDRIQEQFKGLKFTRLEDEEAVAETVLQAMTDHNWVHFACHASQDSSDPHKSALHLHDQALDLATISNHPLKNAQLAFMSACQTATGDSKLPDEAIHLAAGLLMAGYSNVVATMWSINDMDAPIVADKFYESLLKRGVPCSRTTALALHKAVAHLRDIVGVKSYERWVPFIHLGG